MAASRITLKSVSETKVKDQVVLRKQNRLNELAELKKGIRLREKEIKIYTELIAEQQGKLNDVTIPHARKYKIEWDIKLLREDIERWTETIKNCKHKIAELEDTAPSTVVKFQI